MEINQLDDRIFEYWFNQTKNVLSEILDVNKYKHQVILSEILDLEDKVSFEIVKNLSNNLLLCEKLIKETDFLNVEEYNNSMQFINDFVNDVKKEYFKDKQIEIGSVKGKYLNNPNEKSNIIIKVNTIGIKQNSKKEFLKKISEDLKEKYSISYIVDDVYDVQGHILVSFENIHYTFVFKSLTDNENTNRTTTEQKELLVILLSCVEVELEMVDKDNFNSFMVQIITQFDKIVGVDEISKEELRVFLNSVTNTPYNRNLLNDCIMMAGLLTDTYDLTKYEIERGELYNRIRSLVKSKFGSIPDKWNPSDIYLIKKDRKNLIINLLNEIDDLVITDITYLDKINDLFEDGEFGEMNKPIIGISLKTTTSRFGTGKGGIQTLGSYNKSKYSISKYEKEFDFEFNSFMFSELRNLIRNRIENIKEIVGLTVNTEIDTIPLNFDNIKLKSKYGNLKLLRFLIDVIIEEKDYKRLFEHLIKYTLSIGKNTPSYYIFQGLHQQDRCEMIHINKNFNVEIGNNIAIVDKSTTQTINLSIDAKLNYIPCNVHFLITNSGSTQPTINISKIEWMEIDEE